MKAFLLVTGFAFFVFASGYKKEPQPYLSINSIQDTLLLDSTEVEIKDVITGLDVPWDLVWTPGGRILFTEQGGRVSSLDPKTGKRKTLLMIKDVWRRTTAGLLGIAFHSSLKDSPYVVLNYTCMVDSLIFSKLVRYNYSEDTLSEPKLLLQLQSTNAHNGSRVVISKDGKIFWATGDGKKSHTAQNPAFINGKILRLNIDGSVPAGNPIPGNLVWASGFRNMQGLVFDSRGNLFTSEHGEANDDEINLIKKGKKLWLAKCDGIY